MTFSENKLTKFRAVYTVKVISGTKCLSSVVYAGLAQKNEITNPWRGP